MKVLLLLLIFLIAAALLWFWWQRRARQGKLQAFDASEVRPTKVMLADEDPSEERPAPRRTGDTQELRRKVVHGPYRAIDEPGAPSEVQPRSQS